MKAIGNNIIITPEKVKTDKTKGGLLIIEKDREDIRYRKAEIVSVSEDKTVIIWNLPQMFALDLLAAGCSQIEDYLI